MARLTWDQIGERFYETGVDHGVLYIPDSNGVYDNGVAWNGLTTVTEKPSGAEPNAQFADNIKYLSLLSAEEFGATIEALTYPPEFAQFDGLAVPTLGVSVGQQARKSFGLSYRTKIGNDTEGEDYGYKLHLAYGCSASPSEKAYTTINDSPEAIAFSWEVTTIPAPVTGYRPTSLLIIDSTQVSANALAALEDLLYGTSGSAPSLPTPDAVLNVISGTALATNVTVASGAAGHIAIGGTTTNYLFTIEHWNGSAYVPVTGGTKVTEAAAEALVLAAGIKRVTLSPANGYYIPSAQQKVYTVNVT